MPIRRMMETDLDAVERIATDCSPNAAIWTRSQHLEMLERPDRYEAWVSDQDGAVAGFLYFHATSGEAELDNLAVDLAWRRRGIAQGLIELAWLQALERGVSAMFLEVRQANTAAIRLYERCGFEKTGARPAYYSNPPEDAICMVRRRLPSVT